MTFQSVRISVGRTWRFVADGDACVDVDLSGYRGRIDALKGSSSAAHFRLPWPSGYRSGFWKHMLNPVYQDTRSAALVAALLPLRKYAVLPDVPGCAHPVESEALWHPFAVTTIVHLGFLPASPWPQAAGASALFRGVLGHRIVGTTPVRDGLPLSALPALSTTDFGGRSAQFEEAGRFVMVSALHGEPDPRVSASSLSLLFDDDPRPADARQLRSGRGAISVTDDAVGFVLPDSLPRAEQRVRCLHHNLATLLGYMENLATLTPATTTTSCRWFQGQAATLLSHLYRRAPIPETRTIYRSRLAELWLDQRGLPPSINELTAGLPPLPT